MGEKEESGRSHRQQEIPPAEEKPTNGTIYDDVFRTMIDKIPHLIIPLINEVFSRQYPDSEPVTALQNEHLEITEGKVIMDSYLKIADKYYHVECQSSPDGTVVDYRTPIIKVNQNACEKRGVDHADIGPVFGKSM